MVASDKKALEPYEEGVILTYEGLAICQFAN